MKKLILASLFVATLGSFAAAAEELTGYISDAMCGAKHNTVSEANTKCVNGCIKKGDAVLVVGDKVMKFDADSQAKAKEFAGKNVTIMASLQGDVVKINSIEAAK